MLEAPRILSRSTRGNPLRPLSRARWPREPVRSCISGTGAMTADLASSGFAALIGAVAGYLAGRVTDWQSNAQQARGVLHAALIEIDRAEECARLYLKDAGTRNAWAPAYRIELDFLGSGVRDLLELRALRPNEVRAIHRLYIAASEVNRCLESLARLQEGSTPEGAVPMVIETSRTRIKCENVLQSLPAARTAAET